MKLRIAPNLLPKLKAALRRAGNREIGGQLFGEQLAPSSFLVTEITVQARRGSIARFIVDLVQATKDAIRFFDRTAHNYSRFNYIGEWHSHPNYAVQPSGTDAQTMRRLVTDLSFQGSFALLMIVRLDDDRLTFGGWLFDPNGHEMAIDLEMDVERQE